MVQDAGAAPRHLPNRQSSKQCLLNIGDDVQTGIDKLIRILEDDPTTCFTAEEYMTLYTTTYNMCTQKAPHEYSEELYQRYRKVFEDYLTDIVRI